MNRMEPEGKSGLILLARRSASALYLRWNLHAGWGIQLGDRESPCVSPFVSPCAGGLARAISMSARVMAHHVARRLAEIDRLDDVVEGRARGGVESP
jgi:hypothetical protein